MASDELYVNHILESITKIETFISGLDLNSFRVNQLVQSAVMRELEIIGEAAKKLSDDFQKHHSDIVWKQIMGMRDKLAHDYFEIDTDAVWKTAKDDLPILKRKLIISN